ncbi:hypothetical protein C8R46DRAFT_437725 [Mycena filopes]|nr:hypothetical protein C8R46DRAFT_437725 [Mycena filopes]
MAAASCSLLDLPTELLVEIVSHYPNTFTFLSPFVLQEYTTQRQDRQRVLQSLSQVCSRLRNLFLPILWKQLDASNPAFHAHYTQSEFAKTVAPYIKSVHVAMDLWTTSRMKPMRNFLDFLCSLPNLAGLQIHSPPFDLIVSIASAFANVRLPTVTALSLPTSLDCIFPCFPNVTQFASHEVIATTHFIPGLTNKFPHLEAFAGLRLPYFDLSILEAKELSAAFPHLRALSVRSTFPVSYPEPGDSYFEHLRAFTNLSELAVVFDEGERTLALEPLIAGCKAVLQASRSVERKALLVWAHEDETGPRVIHVERW